MRQFEQMDVYTPNTANGISNARDKLRATQILSRHNIGMPATTSCAIAPTCVRRSSGSAARRS